MEKSSGPVVTYCLSIRLHWYEGAWNTGSSDTTRNYLLLGMNLLSFYGIDKSNINIIN